MSPFTRRLAAALLSIVLAAATFALQDAALARRSRFSAEEDVLYLPRASALKPLSLGHHELTADLILIRALIYFGGELGHGRQYKWLDKYLDTIVALDPHWKTPYRWAGVATMYDGRPITNERVQLSSHFLELGVRQFPADWEMPFMLGCNYLFELKTDDPAQHEAWQRQGGEWVRHAAILGGAPSWVPLLAATILHKEGRDEAAIKHLEEVYVTTQDPKTRAEVKNRLVSLHAQLDFAREASERQRFETAWKRTLPYAPPDFFIAVGARPSPRMDLDELAHNAVLELDLDAKN